MYPIRDPLLEVVLGLVLDQRRSAKSRPMRVHLHIACRINDHVRAEYILFGTVVVVLDHSLYWFWSARDRSSWCTRIELAGKQGRKIRSLDRLTIKRSLTLPSHQCNQA
jgi:hypothetical protein